MYRLVKLNDDSLKLDHIFDDNHLKHVETMLWAVGLSMPLFVVPTDVGGEFKVLMQCAEVQALRNMYSSALVSSQASAPVPAGVYVKDGDWYVDAAIGQWTPDEENFSSHLIKMLEHIREKRQSSPVPKHEKEVQ